MSKLNRSDRIALITLALTLLAIVACVWISKPPHSEKTANQPPSQVENTKGQPIVHLGLFTPTDTYAQWIMAMLSLVATGISAWAVFLIRNTLVETRKAVSAADDAVIVTRETGRDQSRAYLHVDGIDFYTGGKDGSPRFIAQVKNSGHTPAKWFYLVGNANLYPIDYTQPFGIEVDESIDRGTTWNALSGGDILTAPIRIRSETVDAIKAAAPNKQNQMLIISGIVRYETFFSEVFESEFMYVLRPLLGFKMAKPTEAQSAQIAIGLAIRIGGEDPHKMQRAGRRLSAYRRVSGEKDDSRSDQLT